VTIARLEKIKACLEKRQPDLAVITDYMHKPHNVSAVMRTCDATGVFSLRAVMPENESFRARSGIAMGSDKWLDVTVHNHIDTAVKQLKHDGFKIVAVHKSERSGNFREVDYCEKTAVLFGAELFGVSEDAANLSDVHASIPMQGMVESYNVSVAAAIVLTEAQRQRELAGMYDHRRLDPDIYARTLFKWYRRKEADYCDEHGLEYPEMDIETGELIDPAAFARART